MQGRKVSRELHDGLIRAYDKSFRSNRVAQFGNEAVHALYELRHSGVSERVTFYSHHAPSICYPCILLICSD
jgi:hypothetical protein